MVKTPKPPKSSCPINFGLEIFGDKWSLLILRDMLITRKSRFRDFLGSDEGISTNILADRLRRLQECGLISSRLDSSDGRGETYLPTNAGAALLPVLVEMSYWGAKHDAATAAPREFVVAYETDRNALLTLMKKGWDPTQ